MKGVTISTTVNQIVMFRGQSVMIHLYNGSDFQHTGDQHAWVEITVQPDGRFDVVTKGVTPIITQQIGDSTL